MNVLVVGGTGFIGQALCRELDDRGHDVTALARDPSEADLPAGVETAIGDGTAYDSIEGAFEGQDAVVNLVALSPLFQPTGGNGRHFEVHLGGTENVVRAAEEHGLDQILQQSALGADPDGQTAYIRAKGQAEDVVRGSDLAWTITRPSVVFGEGGEFVSFTRTLTTPYVTGLPGGGRTRFQPIWVGDLVPMLADCLTDETHRGETYELGGPEVLTLRDVALLAHRASGRSLIVVPVPMALARVGLTVAGALPGFPMGADQYRSLQFDNTVADNDVTVFGVVPDDLRTLANYLDVEAEVRRPGTVAALVAALAMWVVSMAAVGIAGLVTGLWRLADLSARASALLSTDWGMVAIGTFLLVGGPVMAYYRLGVVSPIVAGLAYFGYWFGLGLVGDVGSVQGLYVGFLYWQFALVGYLLLGGGEYLLRRWRRRDGANREGATADPGAR